MNDPLKVKCPYCEADPTFPCMDGMILPTGSGSFWEVAPHQQRKDAAK